MDECAPSLREQFPDLAAAEVPEDFGSEEAVWAWLEQQVGIFGETREVAPLREGEHTRIDPITEIGMVAPHAEIITVVVPDGKPGS